MSITTLARSQKFARKVGLSGLLLIATTFFFVGDHVPSARERLVLTALPTVFLLGLTLFFYRNQRLRRYWEVTFAFFSGSCGLFLAWNIPDAPLSVIGGSISTPQGVAVLKFFELLPVALTIIVLTRSVQGSLAPIYIQRGDLRNGPGLGSLLGIAALTVYLALSWSSLDPAKAVAALPWLIAFAVSNALFEELLLRGLLLRRFSALLGTRWALVVSALCYSLFFLGVQAAVGPVPYGAIVVILPLGLLYAYLMQNSDSIWGPVSLHAVLDLIFLLGVFASI